MTTKEALRSHPSILLSLPSELSQENLETSLTLYAALRLLKKEVAVRGGSCHEHVLSLLSPSKTEGPGTFVVSLKGLAPWISSVSYEKGEQDLRLFFSLNKGTVSSDRLSLEQDASKLTIIVGDGTEKHNRESSPAVLDHQRALADAMGLLPPDQRQLARAIGILLAALSRAGSSSFTAVFSPKGSPEESARLLRLAPGALETLVSWLDGKRSFGVALSLSPRDSQGLLYNAGQEAARTFGGTSRGPWTLFPSPGRSARELAQDMSRYFASHDAS